MDKRSAVSRKTGTLGSGLGVGYVSVMVIFVTVCLTLFAALSLRAASSNDAFNEHSGEYLKLYYSAENKANRVLAELDGAAKKASEGLFFEDEFELVDIKGVEIERVRGGCEARFSVKIDDRRELRAEVIFSPNGSYEITRWQSADVSSGFENSNESLWDGNFNGGLI